MSWELKRTTQCAKCPWRVDVNPHDIPNGYSEEKHAALACTIAAPGSLEGGPYVMACHETSPENETHCVGWLAHQLGTGNNLRLRMSMINCSNARKIRVVGKQHQTFAATLPKNQSANLPIKSKATPNA